MGLRAVREANEALRRQNELLEEEARRIAHEVHDSSAQLLASVHAELDRIIGESPAGPRVRLERMRGLLDGVEGDLRRLAHELRPTMLDDLGLLPALRSLAESVGRRAGLKITVTGPRDGRLPSPVETVLYRVVQEALTNVSRHARATRAVVTVERGAAEARCAIADDGIGFVASSALKRDARPGLGLIGIRERLAVLGGSLRCETGEGDRGARLSIVIPLEVSHAAARTDS
jgi:signal transduction histidine kinase